MLAMANRSADSPQTNPHSSSAQPVDVEEALDELMSIDGAVGAAVVDYENGLTLGAVGGGDLDIELAGAGNTEVVRAKKNIIHDLGLDEEIGDILISLESQYHLIRMCESHEDLFIYLMIDQDDGNLALARRSIDQISGRLELN